jgi:hypothetical protein
MKTSSHFAHAVHVATILSWAAMLTTMGSWIYWFKAFHPAGLPSQRGRAVGDAEGVLKGNSRQARSGAVQPSHGLGGKPAG